MDVCLWMLKESNKGRFYGYSVRNSVLIISHVTLYGPNSFRIIHKIVPHLGLPLIKLVSNQQNFFVRQEVTSRRSHHVWWLSCTMPSLTWTALSVTLTRGARCFSPFMTPEKDGLSGAWEYLSTCCFQEMLKQIRELRKPRWRRQRKLLLR